MRKSKGKFKALLTLALALLLVFSDASPILAVFAQSNISFAELEAGVRYSARFNYNDTFLRDKDGQPYQEGDVIDPSVSINDMPDPLIVVLEKEGDVRVRIVNEDWPAKYDEYRYVEEGEITVLERLDPVDPEPEPEVGQVGLTVNGETVSVLTIAKGEKAYVFAELGGSIAGAPSYSWQLLIDAESDRWATISDYVYPYAVVSGALIANAGLDGAATLRCIVTAGGQQYISSLLRISADGDAAEPAPYEPLQVQETTISGKKLLAAKAQAENVEAFHIVVNYTFRHATAADPEFDGSAAAGIHTVTRYTSYTGTVTSPRVVGYLPYVKAKDVEYIKGDAPAPITYDGEPYYRADEIYFDAVSEMTTVDVYYIPQTVYYMVKYYEQNLHNDEYVLAGTTILQGLAESPVGGGLDPEREGFTPLYYDPNQKINGDGSAEVDIYYDRNYYLVDFDLDADEAYGATPYYVRYNAQVMLPNPTRPGYTFDEWKLDRVYTILKDESVEEITGAAQTEPYDQKTAGKLITVQHNVDYSAKWEESTTSYTIAYWLEDPEYVDPADPSQVDPNEKYKIWGTVTKENVAVGSTVNGPTASDRVPDAWVKFSGLVKDDGNRYRDIDELNYLEFVSSDQNVEVKGDGSTVVNVYYDRKEYTLKFYYARSNTAGTQWYVAGQTDATTSFVRTKSDDELVCLNNNSGSFGQVQSQPTLKEGVVAEKGYTEGVDSYNNYQYYYISFKAKYGADISDQYPCDIFKSVERTSAGSSNGWNDRTVLMSAWSGEYNVMFSQVDGNKTMKGKFQILDYRMLWDPSASGWNTNKNDNTVAYLAFWENAINVNWNVPELYRYKIWLEVLDGQNLSGKTIYTRNGRTFYLQDVYDTCDNSTVGEQTQPTIKGFSRLDSSSRGNIKNSTYNNWSDTPDLTQDEVTQIRNLMVGTYNEAYVVNYFYTRNEATLGFNNSYAYNEVISVPYEQSLSQYASKVPVYPSSVEEGAIVFAGDPDDDGVGDGEQWYLDKGYGLPFSFNVLMDVSNIQLYAKWNDCEYTANVYLDEEKGVRLGDPQTVKFGSLLQEPDYKAAQAANPAYEKLIFAGWYYMDGDEEKRFDFNTMLLKQDLDIYAKWTSKVPVPYTVYYVVEKADGALVIDGVSYEEIADRTQGVSLAGISKSFTPKVGAELYAPYQKAYFPQNRSHSIKMSSSQTNEYAFVYSAPVQIEYSVVHTFVDDDFISIIGTNTIELTLPYVETAADKSSSVKISFRDQVTKANIVSATGKTLAAKEQEDLWTIVTRLSPDVYEQELIITTNPEENVAAFYWADRELVSVYQVIHKFQSADGSTYVAELPMEFVGNIGDTAVAKAVERYGFVCTAPDGQVSGKIQKIKYENGQWTNGLVLELKYDRVVFNYTVHHRSGMVSIADSETYTARFGTVVKYADRAKTIEGYALSNGENTVEISKEGQELICYYQGLDVYYRYQVSGRVLGGMLEPDTSNTRVGQAPEPTKLTVLPGYILNRWYYTVSGDGEEREVPAQWLSADRLTLTPAEALTEWAGKTITICAEVVPTSLTIYSDIASGVANSWVTENQGFLYRITGKADSDTAGISLLVAVPEGESSTVHGLPAGEYTITLESDWSWRYGEAVRIVTLKDNQNISFGYEFPPVDLGTNKYYITDEAVWLDTNS